MRYQIALIQDKAGMARESVRSFESLLKDRPEDASLLNALGYSLADRNQKLPRAETLIRKALAASPDNPAFLDSLGWVLLPARRHRRARCRTSSAPTASSPTPKSPRTGASCCG